LFSSENRFKRLKAMENKKEMRTWLDKLGLDHPLVIAGPCSAETEEQVLRIAHELKDTDVN
jgi:chorismate mutase